jgi:hypothetical protein
VGADISFLSVSVDAIDGGPAEQIGLDTDHPNIEERDPAAATCRAAPPTQPCGPAQLVGLTLPPRTALSIPLQRGGVDLRVPGGGGHDNRSRPLLRSGMESKEGDS